MYHLTDSIANNVDERTINQCTAVNTNAKLIVTYRKDDVSCTNAMPVSTISVIFIVNWALN